MSTELKPTPQVKPIWGSWLTILFGIFIFIGYALVQGIVAAFFAADRLIANPETDLIQLAQDLSDNGLMLSLATIFSAAAGVGLIFLIIRIRKGPSFTDYLQIKTLTGKMIVILCAIGVLLISASAIINMLLGVSEDAGFSLKAYQSSQWPWLFGIAVVIFAPAFEESFFRGFLFVGLRGSRLGAIGTILLTSVIWSVLHLQYNMNGMATILVLGIVLGFVRLKTGTLWGSLVIHSFWNLLTFISISLAANGLIN